MQKVFVLKKNSLQIEFFKTIFFSILRFFATFLYFQGDFWQFLSIIKLHNTIYTQNSKTTNKTTQRVFRLYQKRAVNLITSSVPSSTICTKKSSCEMQSASMILHVFWALSSETAKPLSSFETSLLVSNEVEQTGCGCQGEFLRALMR